MFAPISVLQSPDGDSSIALAFNIFKLCDVTYATGHFLVLHRINVMALLSREILNKTNNT